VSALTQMLRAAKRAERLTLELEQAREELREKVVVARDSGESVSEIARQLGVTRTRVYQLLDRSS
jgi:DNA-binding MarR family transcriptional regulator